MNFPHLIEFFLKTIISTRHSSNLIPETLKTKLKIPADSGFKFNLSSCHNITVRCDMQCHQTITNYRERMLRRGGRVEEDLEARVFYSQEVKSRLMGDSCNRTFLFLFKMWTFLLALLRTPTPPVLYVDSRKVGDAYLTS